MPPRTTHVSDYNPYQPPAAPPDPRHDFPTNANARPLASLGQRFAASMIDGILLSVIVIPAQLALGVYANFPKMTPLSPLAQVGWGVTGFFIYCALQSFLLARDGQTIGKKLVKIRIVASADGSPVRLEKVLFVRQLPIHLAGLIPVWGQILTLIDVCLIFRSNRRCLHDEIARTEVRCVD